MTLYLTDNTPGRGDCQGGRAFRFRQGGQALPGRGDDQFRCRRDRHRQGRATLAEMEKLGLPLLVHGEVTDPAIDLFDREKVFIDTVLLPL
jgi:dihydroorotase